MRLSPIVLFVYNRPVHTRITIEALLANKFASESELYVFCDGPRAEADAYEVSEVRSYLKTINGFKKISVIENSQNLGLAKSIESGVTDVISRHKSVIVLEDDIVTSPSFLEFMNRALNFYEKDSNVWHISGWNYPISFSQQSDIVCWRLMNCWGWGTWQNRWQYFKRDSEYLLRNFNKNAIYRFDIEGAGGFWQQVLDNHNGKIKTWAIFWYATIFSHNGLCINPTQSFVENIGFDGSGINCTGKNIFHLTELNKKTNINFEKDVIESRDAIELVKEFYKKNRKTLLGKILNKLSRWLDNGK